MNKAKLIKSLFAEQAFWTIGLGALFFLTYGTVNHYTSQLPDVEVFMYSWETAIPFVAWMIIPYMSSGFIIRPFISCNKNTTSR